MTATDAGTRKSVPDTGGEAASQFACIRMEDESITYV